MNRENRLQQLHSRCIWFLRIILKLEKINSEWHDFMDNLIDHSLETDEFVNKRLDINNDKIQRAWRLYKETRKQINYIWNF